MAALSSPAMPARLQVLAELGEPVSTYQDALWRIFEYTAEAGVNLNQTPMPWAIQFVADMFWVNPNKVRADLLKMRRPG